MTIDELRRAAEEERERRENGAPGVQALIRYCAAVMKLAAGIDYE